MENKKNSKTAIEERLALLNILEDAEEDRKIAEEEKDKTQAIIYNFSDGLLFFDNEKILRIFNPEAEIYFEVKAKEVVEKEISALKKFDKLRLLINFLENKSDRIFREELKIEESLVLEVTTFPVSSTKDSKKIGILIVLLVNNYMVL